MPVKFNLKQPDFNDPAKQLETLPASPPTFEEAGNVGSPNEDGADQPARKGYGNPPPEHQFRKGNPGGPGRPPGSKNRKTLWLAEINQYLKKRVEGKRITKLQAGYRQLANKWANGDVRAMEFVEKLHDKLCGPEPEAPPIEPPLSEAELNALNRLLGE